MNSKIKFVLFALLLNAAPAMAQDYVVQVSGFVCEFCALGVSKKVSKLDFVDRTRYDNGLIMDSQNQTVTIAVKEGETLDRASLVEAVESAGYKVESIAAHSLDGERAMVDS